MNTNTSKNANITTTTASQPRGSSPGNSTVKNMSTNSQHEETSSETKSTSSKSEFVHTIDMSSTSTSSQKVENVQTCFQSESEQIERERLEDLSLNTSANLSSSENTVTTHNNGGGGSIGREATKAESVALEVHNKLRQKHGSGSMQLDDKVCNASLSLCSYVPMSLCPYPLRISYASFLFSYAKQLKSTPRLC